MLLGAPSIYNWRGSTVTYRDGSDFPAGLARSSRPSNAFNQDNADPFIPHPKSVKKSYANGLLGVFKEHLNF